MALWERSEAGDTGEGGAERSLELCAPLHLGPQIAREHWSVILGYE